MVEYTVPYCRVYGFLSCFPYLKCNNVTPTNNLCPVSGLISMRIRIKHFWVNSDPDTDQDPDQNSVLDPNPEPGIWWPKAVKFYSYKINSYFLYKKLQYNYPYAPWTSKLPESLQPSKIEHTTLQNMEFLHFFSSFCGSFCPARSGSSRQKKSMWIWIYNQKLY